MTTVFREIDNRGDDVKDYMEDRIAFMKRRIKELEAENDELKRRLAPRPMLSGCVQKLLGDGR